MRLLGQTVFAASVVGLSFMAAPACVENDQSIYIRQVMAPPASRTNGACLYTPDPTQAFISEGVVDVALRDNYVAELLIGNQMIQRGDVNAPRTESNKAHIDGAIVRVTDANGGSIGEFTAATAGFADAANGVVASFGLAGITMLDAPTLAKASASVAPGQTKLILANVKVFGETLGGVDLESAEFQFPIRVCNRCLVSFVGKDDPLTPGIDCNIANSTAGGAGGGGGTTTTIPPCVFGQDEVVDCALCKDTNQVCRSRDQ